MLTALRLSALVLFSAVTIVTGGATLLGCAGFPKGNPGPRVPHFDPNNAWYVAFGCCTSSGHLHGPEVHLGPGSWYSLYARRGGEYVYLNFPDDGSQSVIDADGRVFPVLPYDYLGAGRRSVVLPRAYLDRATDRGLAFRGLASDPIVIPGPYVRGFRWMLDPPAAAGDERVRVVRASHDIRSLSGTIRTFRVREMRLPASLDELAADLGGAVPHDPWGTPYVYRRLEGDRFEVVSLGADGEAGGDGFDADVDRRSISAWWHRLCR